MSRDRQRPHRGDHLGQARGDLVEAAGEHGDVVTAAVHLDPDAVELDVDRGRHAGGVERFVDRRRALGEHRRQRTTDLQGELGRARRCRPSARRPPPPSGRRPAAAPAGRWVPEPPPPWRSRRPARPAWAPWRSSPLNSPTSMPLLVGRGGAEQRARAGRAAGACEPGPLTAAISAIAASTSATVRVGCSAGGGQVAQAGVAHAGLPLAELAREVGRPGHHLVGRQTPQRARQQLDLGKPLRGRRHGGRRGRQLYELHGPILAKGSDGFFEDFRPEPMSSRGGPSLNG